MMKYDLHLHSLCSDGTDSPAELVSKAKERNLSLIALTDHDSISGNRELIEAGQHLGIDVIPGVEFSVENYEGLKDIDVLAYFPDHAQYFAVEDELGAICKRIQQARLDRVRMIVAALTVRGITIAVEDILTEENKGGSIGRKHIAIAVFERNKNMFQTQQQIFDEYLGDGCCADVELPFQLTLPTVADLVKKMQGYVFVAHPGVSNGMNFDKARGLRLIEHCCALGFDGAEGYYLYHKNRPYVRQSGFNEVANQQLCEEYVAYITSKNKLFTCGSDYHGANKDIELGECFNHRLAWTGISLPCDESEKLERVNE